MLFGYLVDPLDAFTNNVPKPLAHTHDAFTGKCVKNLWRGALNERDMLKTFSLCATRQKN